MTVGNRSSTRIKLFVDVAPAAPFFVVLSRAAGVRPFLGVIQAPMSSVVGLGQEGVDVERAHFLDGWLRWFFEQPG